jgi:hypothetical protein
MPTRFMNTPWYSITSLRERYCPPIIRSGGRAPDSVSGCWKSARQGVDGERTAREDVRASLVERLLANWLLQ